MPEDRDLVQPRNVTLLPVHWATVEAYAKDQGYGSVSAALRRIIDEWHAFKEGQLYTHRNYYDPASEEDPCKPKP